MGHSTIGLMVAFEDIAAAHERIKLQAKRTPVLTSSTVDAHVGAKVFFKCENFQRMGAFKFRGAFNALSQLSPEQRKRGVIAFSSGNHAQAVALSGKILGVKAVIVMPHDAPKVKLEATRGYGAEVVQYTRHEEREQLARQLAAERGLTLVPPFDHPHIVAGQGTSAKELFEDAGALDVLVVPCGGGGLLSGCAVAAKHLSPKCKVIGVEPAAGDDATQSFKQKRLVTIPVPDTIADGARTPSLGEVTFPLVMRYVDDMLTVSDDELKRAMFYLWERMKIVVEPTGALAYAALHTRKLQPMGRIGVVLSGGNVDLAQISKA
ncbi:MAG TPA: threo-3-hydroxy-L-aspartate ammonia-lyase [Burkholderiales bacterium]